VRKKAVAKMGLEELIPLIGIVVRYGVPAVTDAIASFKAKNGADPTVAEIQSIMDGVTQPEDF
jgi:hypothetical protein